MIISTFIYSEDNHKLYFGGMEIGMKKWFIGLANGLVIGYNHEKFWKMRDKVINAKTKNIWVLFLLFRVKKIEAKQNCTLGTRIGSGAKFEDIPILPHHLNGIVISPNVSIGKNARIFHQVTIGQQDGKAPNIGDNVNIGAGAKIIGNVTIGNDVRIGANAVVISDLPDNCFVAGVPAKIKKKF